MLIVVTDLDNIKSFTLDKFLGAIQNIEFDFKNNNEVNVLLEDGTNHKISKDFYIIYNNVKKHLKNLNSFADNFNATDKLYIQTAALIADYVASTLSLDFIKRVCNKDSMSDDKMLEDKTDYSDLDKELKSLRELNNLESLCRNRYFD